ncbi:MAG: hypothetical protein F4Y27_06265 [Acidimicrobiaceae bacterium]|nr:hypothetical protein [Acidimicrobiaceae bacterium]MYG56014.1 hypothetical protein [Acidimicrobiaceae bacterium]MYK00008.1 hypothetical protein [Acidimicrobiaceae bacterium]
MSTAKTDGIISGLPRLPRPGSAKAISNSAVKTSSQETASSTGAPTTRSESSPRALCQYDVRLVMYSLRRFNEPRFERLDAIIDSLNEHLTDYIQLVGSATLPLPEVCAMAALPASAVRVEGHLQERYFPASEPVDLAERIIEEETRRIFSIGDEYQISAQPHSATQANQAVYRSILGDGVGKVAALSPQDGGHYSFSAGVPPPHEFVPLPISEAGLDYDEVSDTVRQTEPTIIVAGGSAYSRAIDFAELRAIADQVGAHLHADLAHCAPFVAAGLHPPAFGHVDSAAIDPSKNLRGAGGGILVFRDRDAKAMREAIFPLLQGSPSQLGLLAKAACMTAWTLDDLTQYASRMIEVAQLLGEQISTLLGEPEYGGTDSHLLLFDVSDCCENGRIAEDRLRASRILVNRNQIPNDVKPPWETSGVRLSSTVPTILGYSDADVVALGEAICTVLADSSDRSATIDDLLARFHRPLSTVT